MINVEDFIKNSKAGKKDNLKIASKHEIKQKPSAYSP